jgi:hypothetical protein
MAQPDPCRFVIQTSVRAALPYARSGPPTNPLKPHVENTPHLNARAPTLAFEGCCKYSDSSGRRIACILHAVSPLFDTAS